jgi:hypothetical protein
MVFLHCFLCHRQWKMAENSPRMQGSLLSLLNFFTCSERNCPCAKARQPCRNCDSSHGQCANMVPAHNAVIRDANCNHLLRSTAARYCIHMGLPPRLLIPLIVNSAECTEDNMSWPQRLPPASNITSGALVYAKIGPNPLCPEIPVRETMWLCCPMEVTPAPPPNCLLAMVWLRCSVLTVAPPKLSYA